MKPFWALLLAASACFPQAPPKLGRPASVSPSKPKGVLMNQEQKDPAAELLRLADDEYFTLSEDRRMQLANAFSELSIDDSITDPVMIQPRLTLGAPLLIDLKTRKTAPLLLGTFETGLRAWQVNLRPNLNLFLKSRATGELLYSKPLLSVRRGLEPLPSGGGPTPQSFQAATTKVSLVVIDLLDRLAGRLTTGDISATAVAYDARSNTIRSHVQGVAQPPVPQLKKQPYVQSDFDTRVQIDSELIVPDHGSAKNGFRIRVAKQLTKDDGVLRTELNQPFLMAHILMVQLDQPVTVIQASPLVQQVTLPTGEQAFNALFLVELGGEKGHKITPGDYRIYLDLGATFLGPYPLKVTE